MTIVVASIPADKTMVLWLPPVSFMGFCFPPAAEPVVANHLLATYRE